MHRPPKKPLWIKGKTQVKEKLKEIERNIDEMYKGFEADIDKIVEKGEAMITEFSYKRLFMKLYLKYPPTIGKQLWRISHDGNLLNMHENIWRYSKRDGWILPDVGKEGYIKIGIKPDRYGNQDYLAKERDNDKVYLNPCKECPDGDIWKWERSIANKGGWFTLRNKSSGNLLTFYSQGVIIDQEDGTYYSNHLDHSWEDLRKKHCNMMRNIANAIGEKSYKCKHESTLFWMCHSHYWCKLCKDW